MGIYAEDLVDESGDLVDILEYCSRACASEGAGYVPCPEPRDTPVHCAGCEDVLPVPLTREGVSYVLEALADGDGRPEILAQWREEFAGELVDRLRERAVRWAELARKKVCSGGVISAEEAAAIERAKVECAEFTEELYDPTNEEWVAAVKTDYGWEPEFEVIGRAGRR